MFFVSLSLFAQKKPLKISDFADWNRIENRLISPNGKFVAFEINKQKGDGLLIIYNVSQQKSDTIKYGYNACFSPNSDYIAFSIKIPEDTLRKLKLAKTKKELMPKDGLGVFNLLNRKLTQFENVKKFQMSEEQSNWLAFLKEVPTSVKDSSGTKLNERTYNKQLNASKTTKPKEKYQLIVWEPVKNIRYTFYNADTFAVAKKSVEIAYVAKENDSTEQKSLILFHPLKHSSDTILRDSLTFKRITFDETGKQLAYLSSADTASAKNYTLYYYSITKRYLSKVADTLTNALPVSWAPSENGEVVFSKDGTKLYFGTAPKAKPELNDSMLVEELPKLDLWSYTDAIIQPQQLMQLGRKKKQTYLAVYRINEKKCVQLADTAVEAVLLCNYKNAEVALGIDNRAYLKSSVWSSRSLNDYSIVNLKTGNRLPLLKAKNNLDLSPMGKYALYFDYKDKNYYSIELKNNKITQLTTDSSVRFYDENHDTPNDPAPYGIAGWTENDKYILIYDRFDIWKFDPTGKEAALNLTNGRAKSVRYRYESLDKDINHIPTSEEILLSAFNEKTNAEGYYAMQVLKPDSKKMLVEGDFMLAQVQKAKYADVLIWSTQTVNEFPDVKLSDLTFNTTTTISKANPQQEQYIWPTVEMVYWNSFAGDSLRGLLYKPDNFDPKRKYPMLVYFYEKSSETSNRYNYPQPSRSIISIPFYVSNEYLVFVPDIAYSTGFPGQNAYDAIVSGVRKLTDNFSFIDEKHIGLQGQSWGGYQIAYLVTRTNMFAAAMAGAPVSNMTSAYGGIRWGTGMSRMFQYEETQSRIGGTLWDKPLHYIENSPLFMAPNVKTPLLIMSNDNDGAVPWYQGIEFFMALYRLQKPVWLINYNGMDHNIENKYWANRVDLSTRMFSFFNHYLKGTPAPEWMIKGIPAIEKGKTLGY
jgi:dipeptidyl aminopeptidase/acylaminoacyl peptidase